MFRAMVHKISLSGARCFARWYTMFCKVVHTTVINGAHCFDQCYILFTHFRSSLLTKSDILTLSTKQSMASDFEQTRGAFFKHAEHELSSS